MEYDPKRVEIISGLHTLANYRQSSGGYLGQYGTRLRSLWNVIRCKNKTSREFLRKPGQNVFGNAYNAATNASENFLVFAGTPASLATFALAFADTPASLAAFALAFAGTPASLAANARSFAGVPQVSRRLLWCLRVLPQVSRRLLWRLRESRKSAFLHFGAYKTVVSISKGSLAVTTCYQRHSL